ISYIFARNRRPAARMVMSQNFRISSDSLPPSTLSAGTVGLLGQHRDSMAKARKGDTPTNANRNQRRRQRTRETILAAAELVFRRKGIDGTTVNDITEQADVVDGRAVD